ncbi:MAG: hypothetical protein ACI4V7_02505 [Succinivibrionaceae bacterium]
MDASVINSDSYGMESLQIAVAKKSSDQKANMALQLVQDTVQANQQVSATARVHPNSAGANPGDRLGQNINIAV